MDEAQARSSVQWLATLALRKLPRTFDGDKDWGKTKKMWSGLKLRRDGLKLRTKRRFREVEHGRWVRYEVTRPDPSAANAASIAITRVTPQWDDSFTEHRWLIEASIVMPAKFTARLQRWNLGIKLFSMTVTGEMRVRMTTSMTVGFHSDYAEIPPALVIDPKVDSAQLQLERFEVDRVSHIGGDVAEQWGELIEDTLIDRFIDKQNERIVGTLNKSIDKERDDLKISMADWFTDAMSAPTTR